MKIRLVGAELCADLQRHVMKLIVAFRSFANTPSNCSDVCIVNMNFRVLNLVVHKSNHWFLSG
jgi:hypothetical protein